MRDIVPSARAKIQPLLVTSASAVVLTLTASQAYVEPAGAGTGRMSCTPMQGTPFRTGEERLWYWRHCIATTSHPTSGEPTSTADSEARQEFTSGYRSAGGPEHLLNHILDSVIPCESTYDRFAVSPAGPYYGLMQFWPPTWHAFGGGDWFSARQQGANTARLLQARNPASQWPSCW